MSEAAALQAVGQVGGAAVQQKYGLNPQVFEVAYGAATKVGRELPHSRKQESEADHIGLVYMARAGYNPTAAVAFWQRFSDYNKKAGGSAGPAFLRTHPLDDVRIEQLKQWLPEAQNQYHPK
ncbi:MAG: putative Zn-dependent protease [Verrucomicrobiales bacterium]|nr:putative Zn-dependent protease [Verrucomicrobiales bacterium]